MSARKGKKNVIEKYDIILPMKRKTQLINLDGDSDEDQQIILPDPKTKNSRQKLSS